MHVRLNRRKGGGAYSEKGQREGKAKGMIRAKKVRGRENVIVESMLTETQTGGEGEKP